MRIRYRIAATVTSLLVGIGGVALHAQPAGAAVLMGRWTNTNGDANNKTLPFVGSTAVKVNNSGVICVLGTVRKTGTWTQVAAEVYLVDATSRATLTARKAFHSTADTIAPWNEARTSPLFSKFCWQNLTPGTTVNFGYTTGRGNTLGRYDIVSVRYANPTK